MFWDQSPLQEGLERPLDQAVKVDQAPLQIPGHWRGRDCRIPIQGVCGHGVESSQQRSYVCYRLHIWRDGAQPVSSCAQILEMELQGLIFSLLNFGLTLTVPSHTLILSLLEWEYLFYVILCWKCTGFFKIIL